MHLSVAWFFWNHHWRCHNFDSRMITKVSCPSENNLAANYLLDYLSWFLSVMFCIALVLRSPFWHTPWFWLLHQHTHWHCVVWNTWWCSPESPLRSHLRLLGSVFLSGIFQEEGLAQHSWSLPLTSLQSQNRQKCWCRIVRNFTYYGKKYQQWQLWLNDNCDGDNGDFDDNDEENDQKTYKYYDFWIKMD